MTTKHNTLGIIMMTSSNFPCYWPFMRGIHRSPVNFPQNGRCIFFICAWMYGRVNNREAGDTRRHGAHYDAIVLWASLIGCTIITKRYAWCIYPNPSIISRAPPQSYECLITREVFQYASQIAKFVWPAWGPPGPFRSQMGPMLAPWILLSGK